MELKYRSQLFQMFTLIGFFAWVASANATAQSEITLGQIHANAGCNLNASSVTLSSKEIRIPMKLSAVLNAEGGSTAVARKSCVMSLPIEIPATHGLHIDSIQVDQSQKLTVGTRSDLQIEVFQPGTQGSTLKITKQATSKVLISKSTASQKTSVLFGCGQSGVLRINSSVLLTADMAESESAASLAKLKLRFKLVPCSR